MKVVDHEPQWWFLLEEDGALFLDGNYNHSFMGYDFVIQLSPEETARYKTEGRAFIRWLAEDIPNSAPILKVSKSPYKDRKLAAPYSERSLAAIEQWKTSSHP